MTKVFKRVCAIFAAFTLSAFCIFENTLSKIAKADGATVVDYSRTDIMDDLSDVDILQYPIFAHLLLERLVGVVYAFCKLKEPYLLASRYLLSKHMCKLDYLSHFLNSFLSLRTGRTRLYGLFLRL